MPGQQPALRPHVHKQAEKTTRVRTVLNEKQLHTLRTCYAANPRPDALMKEQLVEMTGLSPRVIRVWFQNKRCKDKKKSILMKQLQQQQHSDKTVRVLRVGPGVRAPSREGQALYPPGQGPQSSKQGFPGPLGALTTRPRRLPGIHSAQVTRQSGLTVIGLCLPAHGSVRLLVPKLGAVLGTSLPARAPAGLGILAG